MTYLSVVSLSTLLLAIIFCQRCCQGFVPPSQQLHRASPTTVLFYTNDPPQHENSINRPRVLTIPVLGPIPGSKPLMVGEDFTVDNPTPLQWQVLEESMYNHREYLKQEAMKQQQQDGDKLSSSSIAGIDAAPLVAFMDDITSLSTIPGDPRNSKYATIAAVVGISSADSSNRNPQGLDSSSATGFMESLMSVFQPDVKVPSNSKIRLVGIGRAALSDFYSRMPSTHYESTQDMYLLQEGQEQRQQEEYITPVLMAQFRLLTDSGERSSQFTQYGRSNNASPVHALNEMSSFANRITSLHEDRKRLVRGLQAAKARLAVAAATNSNDVLLEDHDGLGQLSSGFTTPEARAETQQDIETLLNTFPATNSNMNNKGKQQHAHERLLAMENYGLGATSASFSEIPGLTRALEEKLQPYYSPEKQASEEHYYEVFSFMGALSLTKFLDPKDLVWTLKCTNTIERMEWVYEKMWVHKKLLKDASDEVSEELRDCGEECTDLW